ncbi:hypothetical protein [Periweissella fabalis]|uniref:Uncharacterized protein n=1 Tax=Periweissella fabalis TaxID=1070421 RepID=A0A7X6N1P6_9LACO|nr:hypothetical protein [Periweissella fabalis]MCM0599383.1 hypothetical protein [Periweissella fabalis]NKZ23662.1 hypothetical protein [Periweissella fabalis]
MIDQRINRQFDEPYIEDREVQRKYIIKMNLSLLVIKQYLRNFINGPAAKMQSSMLFATFFAEYADLDINSGIPLITKIAKKLAHEFQNEPLFESICDFFNELDEYDPGIQAIFIDCIKQIDDITEIEDLITVLHDWYDTYVNDAIEAINVHANYVPLPVIDELVRFYGLQEHVKLYVENCGSGAPQLILGGKTSSFVMYDTNDDVTQFFSNLYQFSTSVSITHIKRNDRTTAIFPDQQNCDYGLINLGYTHTAQHNQMQLAGRQRVWPSRNSDNYINLAKLRRLLAPDGRVAVFGNKTSLQIILQDNLVLDDVANSKFVEALVVLKANPEEMMPEDMYILYFDMKNIDKILVS